MKYNELVGYLIAVDLDNTIVSGLNDLDKESFDILKELSKKNYIVIATGRPWRASVNFYNYLNLSTPIINYNGAYVHNPKDSKFEEIMITVSHEQIKKFVNESKEYLINIFCEYKDDIYLQNKNEYILPYVHLDGGNLKLGDFNEILDIDTNGAILFSKPGSEDILEKYVTDVFKGTIKLRNWFTNETLVSEFYSPLTSKANALEKIRKYYSIPKEKTIAIGDGHNDIEMLEYSNIAVAMEDSHPDLLKIASYITSTVKNHGVKQFFINHEFDKL